MEEGGGLFDTPEYYKAALEQEQLENAILRKRILELNNELAARKEVELSFYKTDEFVDNSTSCFIGV